MPLNLPPPKASGTSTEPLNTNVASSSSRPVVNGSNGHAQYTEDEVAYSPAAEEPTTSSGTASSSSFSSKLGLPPPKTKSKLAAASQPKKFVLDLPKTTRSASEFEDGNEQKNGTDEPAAKRPRTAGGLGALLPEPKKPAAGLGGLKLPEPKSASLAKESSKPSTSMIPHTLKGKTKPAAKASETPLETPVETAQVEEDDQQEEDADSGVLDFFGLGPAAADNEDEDDDEPADDATMDFFGLSMAKPSTSYFGKAASGSAASMTKATPNGRATAAPSTSILTTVKKVSAAPTTAAPDLASNYYATLPVPTKTDPYPGFYQKPDGSWAPKRPDEWEVWSQAQGWGEDAEAEQQQKKEKKYKMPADFSAEAAEQSVEVRAANLRGKQNDDLLKPNKFSEEEQQRIEQEKSKAKAKKFSHNARSRHQLTTLVADAQMNRTELEDRISHMKSNKRTGGQKYGF